MRKRINKIRIPLEDLTETEREITEKIGGRFLVVVGKEPCLTCGHKKRLLHVEKSDGRRELIKECLYCMCNVHLKANREGP